MNRVSAPGLPPWPHLMFDPEKKRAVVSVWHPIWRSTVWARRASEVMVWIVFGILCWLIWSLTAGEIIFVRTVVILVVGFPVVLIVCFSIRIGAPGFLARRIFATRTTVWFTENGIAFRSRLYPQRVVIWRKWQGQPVRCRFVLAPDKQAEIFKDSLKSDYKGPKSHLNEAAMVEMVMATVEEQNTLIAKRPSAVLRSIPVTEVSSQFAQRFTMVYAAAAVLTGLAQQTSAKEQTVGIDIDTQEH